MPVLTGRDFWDAIRRSAALVRGLPAWTSAGVRLSCNFDGGQHSAVECPDGRLRCVHCGALRE